MRLVYFIVTSLLFTLYWVNVGGWIASGDVEPYGWIGAGIAANGAFIGNLIWEAMHYNDVYKADHNGQDSPVFKKLKSIF